MDEAIDGRGLLLFGITREIVRRQAVFSSASVAVKAEKIQTSWAGRHTPAALATQEGEAGGLPEARSSRPAWAI
jgi:hypothetical protein